MIPSVNATSSLKSAVDVCSIMQFAAVQIKTAQLSCTFLFRTISITCTSSDYHPRMEPLACASRGLHHHPTASRVINNSQQSGVHCPQQLSCPAGFFQEELSRSELRKQRVCLSSRQQSSRRREGFLNCVWYRWTCTQRPHTAGTAVAYRDQQDCRQKQAQAGWQTRSL